MASVRRTIRISRTVLLLRKELRTLDMAALGAYLWSLCVLADAGKKNPREGCLCVGERPMDFDAWRSEMTFYRKSDARRVFATLMDVGLFDVVTIGGDEFTRVVDFAAHDRNGRFEKSERRQASKRVETSPRDDRKMAAASAQDGRDIGATSPRRRVGPKELTPANGPPPPIGTILRSNNSRSESTIYDRSTTRAADGSVGSFESSNGLDGPEPIGGMVSGAMSWARKLVGADKGATVPEAWARRLCDVTGEDTWMKRGHVQRLAVIAATPQGNQALVELVDVLAKAKSNRRSDGAYNIANLGAYANSQLMEMEQRANG